MLSAEESGEQGIKKNALPWWPQAHPVEGSCHGHLLTYRCLLHRHPVVPVEGVCHHPGQLPPALCPQVPAEAILPSQLLEAHIVGGRGRQGRLRSPRGRNSSSMCMTPSGGRGQWTVRSWLAQAAPLRHTEGSGGRAERCTYWNLGCYGEGLGPGGSAEVCVGHCARSFLMA